MFFSVAIVGKPGGTREGDGTKNVTINEYSDIKRVGSTQVMETERVCANQLFDNGYGLFNSF